MGWRHSYSVITNHSHECSKPTVWDGDSLLPLPLFPFPALVLSPPCGMETACIRSVRAKSFLPFSKPTVWDGDLWSIFNGNAGGCVPSPPCGMVTYKPHTHQHPISSFKPTVWDGDFFSMANMRASNSFSVPSPPCGMATKANCQHHT